MINERHMAKLSESQNLGGEDSLALSLSLYIRNIYIIYLGGLLAEVIQ